jgi:hypothetical protein
VYKINDFSVMSLDIFNLPTTTEFSELLRLLSELNSAKRIVIIEFSVLTSIRVLTFLVRNSISTTSAVKFNERSTITDELVTTM